AVQPRPHLGEIETEWDCLVVDLLAAQPVNRAAAHGRTVDASYVGFGAVGRIRASDKTVGERRKQCVCQGPDDEVDEFRKNRPVESCIPQTGTVAQCYAKGVSGCALSGKPAPTWRGRASGREIIHFLTVDR